MKSGKSTTKRNFHCPAGDQLEAARQVRAQRAEHALDDRLRVGGDERHRARARRPRPSRIASISASPRNFAIGERTLPSASKMRYASPLPPHSLRELGELVEVLARERLGRTGHAQAAHDAAGADGAREDAELGARHLLADVADLEAVAQVGLVGAVARERLA